MFSSEDTMQAAVHNRPELVLAGIPEINPDFCPDVPVLVSLGREISLFSGPVDNLFIDVNAVLTFVECKRYCDSRLKREVYPQALNYASDLQNQLLHYNRDQFYGAFGKLLSSAQAGGFSNIEDVVNLLSKDPLLTNKNMAEWRKQFLERLEHNVKHGVCRVVLLCAPAPNNVFNYRAVRNLMQLMSFSEQGSSKYDLLLMDLREERGDYVSRIIWRRYASLPQIPLVAETVRDTSVKVDRMKQQVESLPSNAKQLLDQLLEGLSKRGFIAVENTFGYAIKREDTKKSIYILIILRDGSWSVLRHQIGSSEPLFAKLKAKEPLGILEGLDFEIRFKDSTQLFEIELVPVTATSIDQLVQAVIDLGG